jgi:hypothetical protein
MKSDLKIYAARFLKSLENSPGRIFALFLFCSAVLLWPVVLNQPIWDEAFSIFPAADFLATHGFNYRALLRQPGFVDAGPTTHGLTLPALYTAIVLKITGGGKLAWCLLHLWQWLLGAGIGTLLVRIITKTHGVVTALLIAALSVYCPLMLTQLGNMYLEVPLLFFCLLSLYFFLENRFGLAAAAGVLACATKETAFVAMIALAMTNLLAKKPSRKSILAGAVLLAPSLALLLFLHWFQRGTGAGLAVTDTPAMLRCWIFLVQAYKKYLAMMPDMLALFVISLIVATVQVVRIPKVTWLSKAANTPIQRTRLVCFCSLLVLGFSGFHFVVWAIFADLSNFASRYLLFILPAMWILLEVTLERFVKIGPRRQWILTAVLGLLLLNRYGIFYPPLVTSDIGVAERSNENRDGFRVQQDYMKFWEQQIPANVAVFHGLPEAYLAKYPVLGYVTKRLTNAVFITRYTRQHGTQLDQFPNRFYILYFFPIVGSNQLLDVYHEALKRPDWRTDDVATFSRDGFKAFVVLVERKQTAP